MVPIDGVALMAREQRDRGNELPHQREHRADVERQLARARRYASTSASRQPGDAIGEQQQRVVGGRSRRRTRAYERVADAGEAGDAFADGAGKSGASTKSRRKRQDLDRIAGLGVERQPARAEAVLKDRRATSMPAGRRRPSSWCAMRASLRRLQPDSVQGVRVDSQFVRVVATSIPTRPIAASN